MRQRAHRSRQRSRARCPPPSRSPSAPAASPGMFTVGLGLLGDVDHHDLQNTASAHPHRLRLRVAPLLALFLRVGGGIFTKAADVGADLVGKVEAASPRTTPQPRPPSPTTSATTATAPAWRRPLRELRGHPRRLHHPRRGRVRLDRRQPGAGPHLPVAARAIGVIASIAGVFAVRATEQGQVGHGPINRGYALASILTVIGAGLVAVPHRRRRPRSSTARAVEGYVSNAGLTHARRRRGRPRAGPGRQPLTEYYTSTEHKPVQDIAVAARTGPATTVLSGISSASSPRVAIVAIAGAIGAAIALGGGGIQFIFYLVALAGMGMLSTTGVVVSEDTFGPVADNAAGIAEMSGEFEGEARAHHGQPRRRWQHHQGRHQGLRHRLGGHRRRGPVRLVHREVIADEIGFGQRPGTGCSARRCPSTWPIRRSSSACSSAGRSPSCSAPSPSAPVGTAGTVVAGGPRQFADGKIMKGHQGPTTAGHRHLHHRLAAGAGHPGPARGADPGHHRLRHRLPGLGASLAATILTGQLMANYQQRWWGVGQRQEVHRGR